jgi:NADP-dependent 3-hydroxy acid dehydrogenase YdfG
VKKIICITGASSGFGEACALKFAANGFDLIITGRRKERLESLKKKIEGSQDCKVLALPLDVQNKAAVFPAIASLPAGWKKIDILVNNAGLALGRDLFDKAEITDWETMVDTNVKGLIYVSKAVLPSMIEKKKGHIINLGSISGDEVYEGGNIYCATKSAVDAISRAMRIDLLKHHIKVTNIKPGATETEFSLVRFKGDEKQAAKIYEGLVPLTPADIADSIFYCASLPPNVCINSLTITCTAQADGIYSYRE